MYASRSSRRRSPIVLAGLALILVRSLCLVVSQALGSGFDLRALLPTLLYTVGEAGLLTGALLLLFRLVAPARTFLNLIACTGIPLLIFVGLIDFFLFLITGDHLTPSVMKQFAGLRLFSSSNFIAPVRAHALPIAAALALVLASFGAFQALFWTRGRGAARVRVGWGEAVGWAAVGAALLHASSLFGSYAEIERPVEVLFAQDYLGADGVRLARSEADSITALRDFLGLPPGERWLNDRYPLVHGPAQEIPASGRARADTPPDIVLVVIESLRGQCLRFVHAEGDGCPTPNLDSLANEGVVFTHYLSNGFPSGPGFITLNASTWPHHRKRIISSFKKTRFDTLSLRLKSSGYHTVILDLDASFDMESDWHVKLFETILDSVDGRGFRSDRELFRMAADTIRRLDAESPRRPLFVQIKTMSPHLPYQVSDDEKGVRHFGSSLHDNYLASVHYVDVQLGGFLDFLRGRQRADTTVILVTGDHANYLDQEKTTSLPLNDTVWTAAVFHGPESLLGPPRRIDAPASHVDIVPTILSFVGDRRPTASLGRDLFGSARRAEASAVVVRPGGLRLDRGDFRLIVDRAHPSEPIVEPALPTRRPDSARGPEALFAPDAARTLLENVLTFSWLMEQDRLWDPALLRAEPSARPASAAR